MRARALSSPVLTVALRSLSSSTTSSVMFCGLRGGVCRAAMVPLLVFVVARLEPFDNSDGHRVLYCIISGRIKYKRLILLIHFVGTCCPVHPRCGGTPATR